MENDKFSNEKNNDSDSLLGSLSRELKKFNKEMNNYKSSREKTSELRLALSVLESIKDTHYSKVSFINKANDSINQLREMASDEKYISNFINEIENILNKKRVPNYIYLNGYFCGYERYLLNEDEINRVINDIADITRRI